MFLDTSGLLSIFDGRDAWHAKAVELFASAPRLLTHNYVLAELVALAGARKLPRRDALDYVNSLVEHRGVEIVWVDELLRLAGMNLLMQRLDKSYSRCDAVSFLLMEQHEITDALTTDRHFEQEGFVRLLK